MTEYILGIDVGTSGTKADLFDLLGNVIAGASREYPLSQPRNDWAEQDPEDWADAVIQAVSEVVKKSGVNALQIRGVGLTGQMHGLVMLDAQGEVLRPAILWCDQRTKAECEEINRIVGAQRYVQLAANPPMPGFTAPKILWVKKHEPQVFDRCRHILLPKDYIRYRLTGEFATEVSDASGTGLLDVPRRCWSREILEKLEIPEAYLGKVYESPEVTGKITAGAAQRTGLAAGTIVAGGAGDNAAAAVGTGVICDGRAFTTIGTSGVVFAHSDAMRMDTQGRVHTFCCAVPGKWHVMGVTQSAGLSLKWFRDQFCAKEIETARGMGVDPYVLMDQQAEKVPYGANRLIYLPYLMGERSPHPDSDCRGVFFGLSAVHTRQDMLRAVMEGVIYSLCDCTDVLREMNIAPTQMRACGGGAASFLWRQMLADALGCEVVTTAGGEGACLGAAILAGVGAGLYTSVEQGCEAAVRINAPQKPVSQNHKLIQPYYAVYKSLYPSLKEAYGRLASI